MKFESDGRGEAMGIKSCYHKKIQEIVREKYYGQYFMVFHSKFDHQVGMEW